MSWRTRFGPESAVFALALGARLLPAVLHGSLVGNYGYDASVYYTSADALVHGRMPYRDFVLLHPPGVMLADTPFAVLGSLTSDTVGFAADNAAFAILGAISAVLVCRVARHLGLPRHAALVGGVVYALWFGSVGAEYEARLEPLGCLLVLCGLLAVLRAQAADRSGQRRASDRLSLLSGVALGSAVSVKIWWIAPVLVLIVWQLVAERAPRRGVGMLLGALLAGALIDLPFFVVAGRSTWRMVVLDELGRPVNNPTLLHRVGYLAIGPSSYRASQTTLVIALWVAAVVVGVMAWRAWRIRAARIVVVLFAVQLIALLKDPSFFGFYADFLTVSLALLVASSVAPRPERQRLAVERRPMWWMPVAAALVMSFALYRAQPLNLIAKFPGEHLRDVAASYRCVISDSPMPLIDANLLSRDLHNGCPNLVDVTGLNYDLLRGLPQDRYGSARLRWNADVLRYLRSGNAMLFMRTPSSLDLLPSIVRAIEQNGLVSDVGKYKLYRVEDRLSPPAP